MEVIELVTNVILLGNACGILWWLADAIYRQERA